MPAIFYDQRWCVQHGIGRFATELRKRLIESHAVPLRDVNLAHAPTDPLDAIRLSRFLRRNGASLFISPGFNVPLMPSCTVVATIHDLIHVHYKQERSLPKSLYYRLIQRPVIRRSPFTLTVSEFSRQQIIQWYGLAESSVVSIGNGISEAFMRIGVKHQRGRPYFMYVGNTKPHKNVSGLLDALMRLTHAVDAELVMIVKEDDWLKNEINSRSLAERITLLSGISDIQLATYYRGAVATVLPSHYEGFGLPLVESMACGCPVIGADTTSIPEVIKGAGELFDPDDSSELAERMLGLINSTSRRNLLGERGICRALDFSWDSVADKAVNALRPILDQIGLAAPRSYANELELQSVSCALPVKGVTI